MAQRRTFRIWLAEHFLHLGWALFGQECDCGANRFNWLARMIGEGQWDDEGEPANHRTWIKHWCGAGLVGLHGSLMPRD